MKKNLIKIAYSKLKEKTYDAYYTDISNENLYEFTSDKDNVVMKLTGFTGDTGSVLLLRDKMFLFVDGRFAIQAKKEIKDRNIKVVKIQSKNGIYECIRENIKKNGKVAFNPKIEPIKTIENIRKKISDKGIKLIPDYRFLSGILDDKNYNSDLARYSLFVLDKKYVSKSAKIKICELLSEIKELGFTYYVTSSLEEIAYLTNVRKQAPKGASNVLSDAFMIIGDRKAYLYTDDKADKKVLSYLKLSGISLSPYNKFYEDLAFIRHKKFLLDPSLNNYYIFKKLSIKNDAALITSPLTLKKSIKGPKELESLTRCNVVDGVAITKAIYDLKRRIKNGEKLSEYDAKCIVDDYRRKIGAKNYLSTSFDTIVAYKENSAICHYSPKKKDSKLIKKGSILLIDSGGNYLFGTTDITRTISLYEKKVPSIVKKYYTLVINSLMTLASQKFPYGITGNELDIVARQNLYNEGLDFEHGTGHGIGYISNVHEGPNRISVGGKVDRKLAVIEPYQLTSDEPGLYFEGQYGIRLENDIMSVPDRKTDFGEFLKFTQLTICPFDRDLIDEKVLDRKIIKTLNGYNKMVRKKLYRKLDSYERKMLLYDTKEFRI